MWGVGGVQAAATVFCDIVSRESSDTLPSCKLRQQQTVRNLGARLLRPDKKRQTPKLPVECETQHII